MSARDRLNLPISIDRSSIALGIATGIRGAVCGAGVENGKNSEFWVGSLGTIAAGKAATGKFAIFVSPAAEWSILFLSSFLSSISITPWVTLLMSSMSDWVNDIPRFL